MSIGEILGIWLLAIILQLLPWGAVDLFVHRKDRQTFSRWVIEEARKRRRFAWFMFGMLMVFQLVLIWLFIHWELHETL